MGERGRRGPLADPNTALHAQPKACTLQGALADLGGKPHALILPTEIHSPFHGHDPDTALALRRQRPERSFVLMSSFFGSARGNAGTTGFGGICGRGDRHSVIHFATLASGVLRGCNVNSSVCCIASLQSLATSPTILLAESSARRIGGNTILLWIVARGLLGVFPFGIKSPSMTRFSRIFGQS